MLYLLCNLHTVRTVNASVSIFTVHPQQGAELVTGTQRRGGWSSAELDWTGVACSILIVLQYEVETTEENTTRVAVL